MDPYGSVHQRDFWYGLVEVSTSRYLIKEDDELPSFADSATMFRRKQNP